MHPHPPQASAPRPDFDFFPQWQLIISVPTSLPAAGTKPRVSGQSAAGSNRCGRFRGGARRGSGWGVILQRSLHHRLHLHVTNRISCPWQLPLPFVRVGVGRATGLGPTVGASRGERGGGPEGGGGLVGTTSSDKTEALRLVRPANLGSAAAARHGKGLQHGNGLQHGKGGCGGGEGLRWRQLGDCIHLGCVLLTATMRK